MTDVRVDRYDEDSRLQRQLREQQTSTDPRKAIAIEELRRKQAETEQARAKSTTSTSAGKSKEDKEENDTDTSGLSSKEVDAKSKKMRDAVARNSLLLNNDDFKAGLNDLVADRAISQMDVDVLNYLLNDSSEFDEKQKKGIEDYIESEAEKNPENAVNISSDILARINDKIKESEEFNSNHKEFASNLDKIQENLKAINDLSRELGEQNKMDVDLEKVDEVAEKTKKKIKGGFALKDGIPPQLVLAFLTPALIPMGGVVVSAAMLVVIMKILPKFTKVRKIAYKSEDGISKIEGNEKKPIPIGLNGEEESQKKKPIPIGLDNEGDKRKPIPIGLDNEGDKRKPIPIGLDDEEEKNEKKTTRLGTDETFYAGNDSESSAKNQIQSRDKMRQNKGKFVDNSSESYSRSERNSDAYAGNETERSSENSGELNKDTTIGNSSETSDEIGQNQDKLVGNETEVMSENSGEMEQGQIRIVGGETETSEIQNSQTEVEVNNYSLSSESEEFDRVKKVCTDNLHLDVVDTPRVAGFESEPSTSLDSSRRELETKSKSKTETPSSSSPSFGGH